MAYERRPKEVRIAEIESKIARYKELIDGLEAKKTAILNPKTRTRKPGVQAVIKQAQELGMSPEDIAQKLGIEIG